MKLRRLLALAIGFAVVPVPAQAQETRPNILVILTDDQRATGTFGVMPALRSWFVEGGAQYTRAYGPTPICCPARATLFSGRYAHNHGVRTNGDALGLDQSRTVQRGLREAGYHTAIFGKYLNSWPIEESPPHFDTWATFSLGRDGYYGQTFNVGGQLREIKAYSTDYISNRAVRFLQAREEADDQPWLLYLTPFAPHAPAIAEPAYRNAAVPAFWPNPAMRETDRRDKPPYVRAQMQSVSEMRDFRARQLRTLMSVDDMVGRVMTLLANLNENTLAIFASDNGWTWGDHGLVGKTTPYTPSILVPLLVRWPGHIAPGIKDNRLVSLADVAPTMAEAAGLVPDPAMDGRSLFGSTRDRVLMEFWTAPGIRTPDWASIRTRTYQYVEYYDGDSTTFREYYDLVNDPWQLVNLLRDGDPSTDPDLTIPKALLAAAKACAGVDCP
jgi:arylsulfatase A-like enzyme